jgi:CheY-like chemotaxis protein
MRRLVLIVEDNPANLLLAQAVLQRAGYLTLAAQSTEDARYYLELVLPHLILMDIQLPGEDGLTLAQRLKSNPVTAGIRIVALTAHAMDIDRARALAAGCDGYITKPLNTRTLGTELAAVLGAPGEH